MAADDDRLRDQIGQKLPGLSDVEVVPRANDLAEIQAVQERLRQLAPDDLEGRLRIAGFTAQPFVQDDLEQACETCMYYLVHRRFCELPELMLPVRPEWSCRLWRI